jgi:hypothetical protein
MVPKKMLKGFTPKWTGPLKRLPLAFNVTACILMEKNM